MFPPCDSEYTIVESVGSTIVKKPSPYAVSYQSWFRMPWNERVFEGPHHASLSWSPPHTAYGSRMSKPIA